MALKKNLRASPSGPIFVGNNVGDVLTWDGIQWVPVPGPAAGTTGFGVYAARPVSGSLGQRYVTSDGAVEWINDGSVWRPLLAGTVGNQVPPVAAWTTVLGVAVTFGDAQGTALAVGPGSGSDNICGLLVAKTAPVTATMHVRQASSGNSATAGVVVRDSGTGALVIFGSYSSGIGDFYNVGVFNFTNPSTFASTVVIAPNDFARTVGAWLRVVDTGFMQSFQASPDGRNWLTLGTQVSSGDEVGIFVNDSAATEVVFDSWELI